MAGIIIERISKSFRRQDGSLLHVLDDVSITVPNGKLCCILGPSGAGKSTILNIICGLETADAGRVELIGGKESGGHESFGYVFQRPTLLNWRTVRKNVEFVLRAQRVPRAEWDERVLHYLELVGLADFINEFPLMLSGGMQQRVGLARALAIEPDILLMDEPFSGLDELTARTMRQNLLDIWEREPKTILFITHSPLEAAYLADIVVLLSSRPARVVDVIDVPIERPRLQEGPEVLELYAELVSRIVIPGGSEHGRDPRSG